MVPGVFSPPFVTPFGPHLLYMYFMYLHPFHVSSSILFLPHAGACSVSPSHAELAAMAQLEHGDATITARGQLQ